MISVGAVVDDVCDDGISLHSVLVWLYPAARED